MNPDFRYLVLHHSATVDGQVFDYRAIKNYHTKTLGWRDIGYNFLVENINNDYEVIVGRPLTMCGAHCYQKDMNRLGIGICFVGNYDVIKPPMDMILRAMNRIIIPLCKIFDIGWNDILGHREVTGVQKSCPGKLWDMDVIRELVRHELK